MKKLLSILLTMLMLVSVICIAPVSTSAAEVETAQTGAPETLYLEAGVWNQADALIRGWVWGATGASDKWIHFTDADGDGTYEAALDAAYTDIIFFRGAPGSTEWNDEWNRQQTKIPTDGKNLYTITDWSAGNWGTYVAPTAGSASSYYLMGSLTDWATGQNMVYAEDTTVVTTTLELELGEYELKIKNGGSWLGVNELTTTITGGGVLGGTDNVTLAADGGTYTFNFTIATKALDIVYTAPVVEEPTTTTVTETPEVPTTTTVTETPEVPAESMTVYFSNNKWWSGTINAYAWDSNNDDAQVLGGWPGTAMTYVETNEYGEDIYSIELPAEATGIIFNDGSNQTTDIPVSALYDGVGVYVADDAPYYGTYDYVETPAEPETTTAAPTTTTKAAAEEPTTTTQAPVVPEATTTTEAADVPEVPAETMTVYFSNNWRWEGTINAYIWNADGVLNGDWPGTAITYVETNDYGEDIYSVVVSVDAAYIIFNDGANQTKDIPVSALYDGVGVYVMDNEEGFGTYDYVETPDEPEVTTTTKTSETPEEPADPQTVYFVDYSDNFSKVYAYAWTNTDNGEDIAVAWPGVEMELTGEALSENAEQAGGLVYSATFDKAYENIIFSGINPDGESTSQTADLIFEAGKYCYWGDDGWYDSIADIEAAYPYVDEPDEPVEPADPQTVYFVDYPDNWEKVYAYAWSGEGETTDVAAEWPGVEMTATGDVMSDGGLVYSYTFDCQYENIIFSNGATSQTDDLAFESDMYLWFGTEIWYTSLEEIEEQINYDPEEPVEEYITVYFQNNWVWDDVCCYYEGSAFSDCDAWPGIAMDYFDNDGTYDVYVATVPADASFIIFNGIKDDGSGNRDQSPDITEGFYDGICYYMTWNDGNAVGSEDITVIFPDMGGEEEEPCEHEFNSNGVCFKCNELQEGVIAGVAGYNLVLGGKIGFNLYLAISEDVVMDESAQINITVPSQDTPIVVPVSDLEYQENGLYKFTVEMPAKEMADMINLTLITSAEEIDLGDYAVKDYCMGVINGAFASDQLKTVAKTMLNYGAASQVYFGYNTANLANSEMTEEDKVVKVYDYSYYAPVIEGESDEIEFYGASLVLESDTYLKFYFKVDESKLPEGAVPGISINGLLGAGLEKNGNLWSVTMPSLAAHELSTEFVLEMSNGHTVTYSANSYIYTAQQSGKVDLVNLANALGAYSNAAGVYGGQ